MTSVMAAAMWGSAAAIAIHRMPPVPQRWRRNLVTPGLRTKMLDAVGSVRGNSEGLRSVLRQQIIATSVAVVAGVALLIWLFSWTNLVLALVVVGAAWQIPLVAARAREKHRREAFDLELSDALGEMVMGVEAGLTLEGVMNLYSQRHGTSLGSEFAYVLDRINLGETRMVALREFHERTPTPGVRMFVAAVQQNQRLGTPLASVLRRQSKTARRQRRQAVEEYSAKLSLKMIFPTVFCILPVLMIVIVGPAIIRLVESLPG